MDFFFFFIILTHKIVSVFITLKMIFFKQDMNHLHIFNEYYLQTIVYKLNLQSYVGRAHKKLYNVTSYIYIILNICFFSIKKLYHYYFLIEYNQYSI